VIRTNPIHRVNNIFHRLKHLSLGQRPATGYALLHHSGGSRAAESLTKLAIAVARSMPRLGCSLAGIIQRSRPSFISKFAPSGNSFSRLAILEVWIGMCLCPPSVAAPLSICSLCRIHMNGEDPSPLEFLRGLCHVFGERSI
jgi:hypothetical protein